MNIYDISVQAGVSIATVSRVLNGSDKVSPGTRQKVLDVIEKNGYIPNAFARSLGLNTMSTVGILCSDASDVYQAQAISYLERELRENSYTSMLCCTGYNLQEKQEYLQLLLSRNVDAVFLIGSHFVEASAKGNRYIFNAARKVPVFILNGELEGENIYSILCDDYSSSKAITDLLFARGSRRPLFLYRTLSCSARKKMEGFFQSCREHGADDSRERALACPGPVKETSRFLQGVKDNGLLFDAAAAADDELAVGAVKYALDGRLDIPGQFQITGYNNSVLAVCSTPEITTLDNRLEFMCVTAVSSMMQVFRKHELPSKTSFTGRIVERGTTGRSEL